VNLPWPIKKLEEVCEPIKIEKAPVGIMPYIEIGDIDVETKRINFKEKGAVKGSIFAPDRCVIVSRVRPTRGAVALLDKKVAVSSAFTILKPKSILDLQFLFYYLAYNPNFFEYLGQRQKGSNYPSCREKDILNFEIPFPPLEIQKRIVARIEELFEKIDKAKELRVKALEETEEIFQSALQEIFDKADKKWRFAKIGNIASDFQSGFACSERATKDTGIPQLRPNNIGFNGEIDLSDLVFIPLKLAGKNKNKYDLKKGDVLFNNTNSKELVGRASLVKRDLKCVFSNHITRIRVNPRILFPEWLVVNINYLWKIGYFLKISQKWIGQAGINTQMLKSIEIPLPPLSEQKRIVAYLDNLREKVEKLKKIQQEQLKDLEELKKSILEKAFKGELII
jgi:type I restriction enzyme S subunit